MRAIGLAVADQVQVSCNLVDVRATRPSEVYDRVRELLGNGESIERAELVGLVPRSLLELEDPARWDELGLSKDATIESRLDR